MHAPTQRLSYWQQEGGAAEPARPAELPQETDIAVIGGGLAGLSTAIAVLRRRPATRVTLLESRFVGFGASGRNGGLISPLPAPAWLVTAKSNKDHAWALNTLNRKVHTLGRWLAETLPQSEVQPCTLELQAMGPLTGIGAGKVGDILEHAGIATTLAPDARRGGRATLRLPAYMVHPYRLVRALAAHAATLGAGICEGCAVSGVEPAVDGATVRLADGRSLKARRVVLCTNAYTAGIAGASVPRRTKVVRNYMLSTHPIEEASRQRLGGAETFVVELNRGYVFYRLHRGRLIYGGVETFLRQPLAEFEVPPAIRRTLERHLARSFPWARELPIGGDWSGAFQSTATDLPVIAPAAGGNVILNVGYGGTGVALTQIFAAQAAAAALDIAPEDNDARLGQIARATAVPLFGLARFCIGVGLEMARRIVRLGR